MAKSKKVAAVEETKSHLFQAGEKHPYYGVTGNDHPAHKHFYKGDKKHPNFGKKLNKEHKAKLMAALAEYWKARKAGKTETPAPKAKKVATKAKAVKAAVPRTKKVKAVALKAA